MYDSDSSGDGFLRKIRRYSGPTLRDDGRNFNYWLVSIQNHLFFREADTGHRLGAFLEEDSPAKPEGMPGEAEASIIERQQNWEAARAFAKATVLNHISPKNKLWIYDGNFSPFECVEILRRNFEGSNRSYVQALENKAKRWEVRSKRGSSYTSTEKYFDVLDRIMLQRFEAVGEFDGYLILRYAMGAFLASEFDDLKQYTRMFYCLYKDNTEEFTFRKFKNFLRRALGFEDTLKSLRSFE
ncbi:hypothetical protein TWF694_007832 [Orbilia ellipsospora]|uniref:Uncharacterized protein n=1 Tax=Orbilia ellipsospora TaxID=2528407 RepID=A0AAV9XKK4_9PEZI